MKRKLWMILLVAGLVSSFCICSPTYAGQWRFPLGLSYISGMSDISDRLEENLDAESAYTDYEVVDIPVGLSFRPYYEWDTGLGVGVDFGPVMLMVGGDADFFNLPVNATCRYTINHKGNTAPYVRLGISHNFASGDYVESGETGVFGAIGIEFMRNRAVGMSIEAAYDSSEIEFEEVGYRYNSRTEKIKPGGVIITLAVVF